MQTKTEEKQKQQKNHISENSEKKSSNVFRGGHRRILIMLRSSFPSHQMALQLILLLRLFLFSFKNPYIVILTRFFVVQRYYGMFFAKGPPPFKGFSQWKLEIGQGNLSRGIHNCSSKAQFVVQVHQKALDNSFSNIFSLCQLKNIKTFCNFEITKELFYQKIYFI